MWTQIEKPRTCQVTRALVKEFSEMETLPRDRPLSERRVQVYRRILAAGEFRPVTWASAYCEEAGCIYRVNGKHTSTMLAGMEKLPDFFVTVERYKCATMEDVAKLYSTFDSNLGTRTVNDIVLAFASTAPELKDAGVAKKTFGLVVTAAAHHEWGLAYHDKSPSERAELLLDNIDFAIWVDGVLFPKNCSHKDGRHVLRSPVVAAMYSTWLKSKSDSERFWVAVRDESDQVGSASRVLAKFLSRSACRTAMTSKRPVVPFREMYVRCIHGWNAFRAGEPTALRYVHEAKIPAAR